MSRGRQIAQWYKRGRLWIVQPPRWPKDTELSFTEQGLMVDWAHNHGYVLKDGNLPKRDGRSYNERFAARDFG